MMLLLINLEFEAHMGQINGALRVTKYVSGRALQNNNA